MWKYKSVTWSNKIKSKVNSQHVANDFRSIWKWSINRINKQPSAMVSVIQKPKTKTQPFPFKCYLCVDLIFGIHKDLNRVPWSYLHRNDCFAFKQHWINSFVITVVEKLNKKIRNIHKCGRFKYCANFSLWKKNGSLRFCGMEFKEQVGFIEHNFQC